MSTRSLTLAAGTAVTFVIAGILYAGTIPSTGDKPVKSLAAQTDSSDLSVVRRIYQELLEPQDGEGRTLDIVATSVFINFEDELDSTVLPMRYVSNNRRMHLISDSLEMYATDSLMLVVLPGAREVSLRDLNPASFRDLKKQSVANALVSLFDDGEVLEAYSLTHSAGSATGGSEKLVDRVLVIEPGWDMRSMIGAERVTIVYNRNERALREVSVEFGPGRPALSTRVEYRTVQAGDMPENFTTPLPEIVMNKSGDLRAPYRGYSLVDIRATTPTDRR